MKSERLYNLSSFSMIILGILVAAGAISSAPMTTSAALSPLKIQGLLTACLLLELGVLFKLYAALGLCHRGSPEDQEEHATADRQLSVFKIAAFTFFALGILNLAITVHQAPSALDVAAAARVSPGLGVKISQIGADMLTTGLTMSVAYLLLTLFSLASALTLRFRNVEERTGW